MTLTSGASPKHGDAPRMPTRRKGGSPATDPTDIDRIVEAMARAIEVEAGRLGELAVEETGYGNAEDKRIKNLFNALAVAEWLRNVKTLGVLWQDPVTKVMAIGEPMGVVAALIPVTNPTSTIIFKVLSAVKSGNAIVCAPHPRGVRSGMETARVMMEAARQHGAPEHLIQCLSEVTQEGTQELMQHRRTSVIMATGGPAMVKTAYSSGKPTLAVGPGNVPVYVHASMRDSLVEVADQIHHLEVVRLRHGLCRRAGNRRGSLGGLASSSRRSANSVATSAARARPIGWQR